MRLPLGAVLLIAAMLAACTPPPAPSGDATVPYGPEGIEGDY